MGAVRAYGRIINRRDKDRIIGAAEIMDVLVGDCNELHALEREGKLDVLFQD